MTADPAFRRIGIVGFGLIGGSVALAAKRRWPDVRVTAIDARPVLDAALASGAADAASERVADLEADLVVLAAPVLRNIAVLPDLGRAIARGALVTDVSSTKRLIVAAAEGIEGLQFVGGHPMAGAAAAGLTHARADMFDGHPWILTPGANHAAALPDLEAFVTGIGGVPHVMTPELHDRFVGAVSHLPQLTSSALMHVVGKLAGDAGLELAGAGLRDATRLAGSPAAIWKDIAATNEDVLRAYLDHLIATLTEMRDSLGSGDVVEAVFTSACRWRDALARARGD